MIDIRWTASRPTWALWKVCLWVGSGAYWLAIKAARWTCAIRGLG